MTKKPAEPGPEASEVLLEEALFFCGEAVWQLFGERTDVLVVRFPEDDEPWYSVFGGRTGGAEPAAGSWTLYRGAAGLATAEALVESAGPPEGCEPEMLSVIAVPRGEESEEDAAFAGSTGGRGSDDGDDPDAPPPTPDAPVFRARTDGAAAPSLPDATDQDRIARALSALRRAVGMGDLPPLKWIDAAALPVVTTLAPGESDIDPESEDEESLPAPVTWMRPSGNTARTVRVPPGTGDLPAGTANWVAGIRLDVREESGCGHEHDDDDDCGGETLPVPDLFIADVVSGKAIVAGQTPSVSPQTLVRRVLDAIVAAGARPAAVAFEDRAAFAVASATLAPLGIEVSTCGLHLAIDTLAGTGRARRQELRRIEDGTALPKDGDGEGWELVHLRAAELIAERLASEQATAAESFKTYFGAREADVDPTVDYVGGGAYQEWRALRPNPSGDRRSPVDRILRNGKIGDADRLFLDALRATKLAVLEVVRTDPSRLRGEPGPLRVKDTETGAETDVRVASMSHVPIEGDWVVGRIVAVAGVSLLTQASPLLQPEDIAEVRDLLKRFGGDLTAQAVNWKPHLLGRLWDWAHGDYDEEAPDDAGEEPPSFR